MTCPGPVHKTHSTILLLIWKQEMMQGVFVAILTFSLGTGKCKGDWKPSRNSVLICVRRDFCLLTMFFTSTAPHPFFFDASSQVAWCFCVSSGIFFPAGAAPKYLCTYYDVVDYLNISSHDKLHTYILPKINLEEPVEVKVDFFLVSILSVVRTQNEFLQQETGLLLGQGLSLLTASPQGWESAPSTSAFCCWKALLDDPDSFLPLLPEVTSWQAACLAGGSEHSAVPELGGAFAGHCHGNVNNNLLFFLTIELCAPTLQPQDQEPWALFPSPITAVCAQGRVLHWIHLRQSAEYLCFSRWKSSRQSVFTSSWTW